jgi:hypothetical protein
MITLTELFVGETYTDVSNHKRVITSVDRNYVRYIRLEDGKPRIAPTDVMLDVLTKIETEKKAA